MKSYEEALLIWANQKWGSTRRRVTSVEIEEVEAEEGLAWSEVTFESGTPAHLRVRVTGEDPWWTESHDLSSNATLPQVIYEVIQAGLTSDD